MCAKPLQLVKDRPAQGRVFTGLTREQEQILLTRASTLYFEPDGVIIAGGSRPRMIYVIRTGVVRLERESAGYPLVIGQLGPGEVLGEMSLVDGSPASANAVADETVVTVYALPAAVIQSLAQESPGFAHRFYISLARILARRLRNTSSWACSNDPTVPESTRRARRTPKPKPRVMVQTSASLESMPRVATQISLLWGTEECDRYLRELLVDTSRDDRQGFPPEIFDELLFLSRLLHDSSFWLESDRDWMLQNAANVWALRAYRR